MSNRTGHHPYPLNMDGVPCNLHSTFALLCLSESVASCDESSKRRISEHIIIISYGLQLQLRSDRKGGGRETRQRLERHYMIRRM